MYNSRIKQKKCKCGCGKFPTQGHMGYYYACSTKKAKKPGKKGSEKHKLLVEADRVFSNWIRNRDADGNGDIVCPGCGLTFNLEDVDGEGKKIVQCLHFIDRGVMAERFNENNAHAGDSYCNLNMHLEKDGLAYQKYRGFLVNKIGEEEVNKMELAHRAINNNETSNLKLVIEKYGTGQNRKDF